MEIITNKSIISLLEDLKGLVNNYNHAVKYNNYWLNAKHFATPVGTAQNLHNLIAKSAQETKTTIYTETIERTKMQISVVEKYIKEKANNFDDKTKRRVLKKLDIRISKMMK